MALDIAVTTESYAGNEDRSWTGARKGYNTCRSITLDVSTFLAAHFTAKGAIPSGTVLGIITATGKYGPYDDTAVDGRAVNRGHLFSTTSVGRVGDGSDFATAPDVGAALFWEGIVKISKLPAFAGTVLGELDAAAQVDRPSIRYEA